MGEPHRRPVSATCAARSAHQQDQAKHAVHLQDKLCHTLQIRHQDSGVRGGACDPGRHHGHCQAQG